MNNTASAVIKRRFLRIAFFIHKLSLLLLCSNSKNLYPCQSAKSVNIRVPFQSVKIRVPFQSVKIIFFQLLSVCVLIHSYQCPFLSILISENHLLSALISVRSFSALILKNSFLAYQCALLSILISVRTYPFQSAKISFFQLLSVCALALL